MGNITTSNTQLPMQRWESFDRETVIIRDDPANPRIDHSASAAKNLAAVKENAELLGMVALAPLTFSVGHLSDAWNRGSPGAFFSSLALFGPAAVLGLFYAGATAPFLGAAAIVMSGKNALDAAAHAIAGQVSK